MLFFDTHCHIDFTEFDDDRTKALSCAAKLGVSKLLVPGVSLAQAHRLLALEVTAEISIYKALGLHPYFLDHYQENDFTKLAELAHTQQQRIVAIGECGIDRSIGNLPLQLALFQQHIELANQLQLPLIIHHRQSHDLIAQVFKVVAPLYGGVVHAFSGSLQVANYYIERGFKLGVGATISYSRAQKTRDVIAQVGTPALVLETDAPSMPLFGFQGQRNEPVQLIRVFDELCDLKALTTSEAKDELAKMLYASSCSLFRI